MSIFLIRYVLKAWGSRPGAPKMNPSTDYACIYNDVAIKVYVAMTSSAKQTWGTIHSVRKLLKTYRKSIDLYKNVWKPQQNHCFVPETFENLSKTVVLHPNIKKTYTKQLFLVKNIWKQ